MTVFGKVIEGDLDYPFDVKKAYPEVSFPDDVQEHNLTEKMIEDGVVAVVQTVAPVQEGYYASQDGVEAVEGIWKTKWLLTPYPEPSTPPVPSKVTMRQARLALHVIDKLSGISEAIASLPEDQRVVAQIEWEYARDVERNSSFVALLGQAVGLDDEGIDNLFLEASKL